MNQKTISKGITKHKHNIATAGGVWLARHPLLMVVMLFVNTKIESSDTLEKYLQKRSLEVNLKKTDIKISLQKDRNTKHDSKKGNKGKWNRI